MIGQKLAHYTVLDRLGAGGMGEVYLARDERLGREVALKLLPREFSEDEKRVARFHREAKLASALSHTNIATIYEAGEENGQHFISMELVKGDTLTAKVKPGGLKLDEILDIAIPLAEGLAEAHEAGVVHRDLKPGNVMLDAKGRVKILDFGLSRPLPASDLVTAGLTTSGSVMGTPHYMAPEQMRGEETDARSDLFSLGVILYELATGVRPFGGDSLAVVMQSVLNSQPTSILPVNPSVGELFAHVVERLLLKDPAQRFQTAAGVAAELRSLKPKTMPAPARRNGALLGLVGFAFLAVAVAAFYFVGQRFDQPSKAADSMEITPFTADGGWKESPQLSPDGEKIAYVWKGPADDNFDIYVKALGLGTRPLRLTEHPGIDRSPAWSPDGRQLAFVRRLEDATAIYVVPSLGGQERKLIDMSSQLARPVGFFPALSWSTDGAWLAYAERPSDSEPSRVVRLSLETLEKEPLTSPPEESRGDLYPSYAPDGTQFAFVRSVAGYGGMDVWVQPAEGGEPRRLTFGEYDGCADLDWTADGRDVLLSIWTPGSWNMLRVSLRGGGPQPVKGIGQNARSASVRGNRMVFAQLASRPRDIWRLPGRGAATRDRDPERLISSSGSDENPAYSPNGRRIAFTSGRSGEVNIWVCGADGSNPIQLTNLQNIAGTPRWSPDSRWLVFDSLVQGNRDIYLIGVDGGVPTRLTEEASAEMHGSWSRGGRWLYFASDRSGSWQIWKVAAEGGEAIQVTRGGGQYAEESWDGRYLYFYSRRDGSSIWRIPLEGGDEAAVVSGPINGSRDWALSRGGIYFAMERAEARTEEYTIQYLDFESGEVSQLYRKEGPLDHDYLAVSPDEQWIIFGEQPFWRSELMLVENFR